MLLEKVVNKKNALNMTKNARNVVDSICTCTLKIL